MSQNFSVMDISKQLSQEGLFIKPNAADAIIENEIESETIINKLIKITDKNTITIQDVERIINELQIEEQNNNVTTNKDNARRKKEHKENIIDLEEAFEEVTNNISITDTTVKEIDKKKVLKDKYPELYDTLFERDLPPIKERISDDLSYTYSMDITGNSRGQGTYDDFKNLFKSRFEKLFEICNKNRNLYKPSDIDRKRQAGKNVVVGGLVWDTFVSSNDNYFITLEDSNTNETIQVVFTDEKIKSIFEEVVVDEFIIIRGTLADNGEIIYGDKEIRNGRPPIMFPTVPSSRKIESVDTNAKAALISDIHIGANEFYPNYWNKFVDWVRETPEIKYIFIAGDIVEGVGVYPNQDEELTIVDLYEQHAISGKMFEQLPDDVQIFASVGNHDPVRLAEPQPTLINKFTNYFPDNVEFLGNPVLVNLGGRKILMYHGMSIHPIAESIPGLDAEEPINVMKKLLKKRHLSPIYGNNVRLAGEDEDYLVIDEVPDVFHTGHVHKWGKGEYNSIQLVNTATWQGQTSFQKSKGIEPDVGYWGVLDIKSNTITTKSIKDV